MGMLKFIRFECDISICGATFDCHGTNQEVIDSAQEAGWKIASISDHKGNRRTLVYCPKHKPVQSSVMESTK